MKKLFTESFMQSNRGCYKRDEMEEKVLNGRKEITLLEFLETNIPLKDKFWFVCKKLATKQQNQQIAITVSEIVLPIYEKRYPEDKRVKECIEAAKRYISGYITLKQLMEKRDAAAAAAYSAAYAAAYAAAAAADAAADAADDAAAAAAYSAAYAAAAAAAANAAADAADANDADALLSFLKTFCNETENKF